MFECDFDEFKRYMAEDEKSSATIENLRDVRSFLDFAKGKDEDKSVLLEYKERLRKDYAVSSANSMIAAINYFLKFSGRDECCIKQFPMQRRLFCPEEKELTKGEYVRLVRTARNRKDKRLELIIQTICSTGIRVSELKYITVEAVRLGRAAVTCKRKTREIFIPVKLRKLLKKYCEEKGIAFGAVFVTRNGKVMNRSNIWREMKDLCREAGVCPQKVFPHNLRHLFARTFYRLEKDIVKLADILGHNSINTTRIYVTETGEEHRRKMEKMRLII